MNKLIIALLLLSLFFINGCMDNRIYCETTFANGEVKNCTLLRCHLGGCEFMCSDGSIVDASGYTQDCD